MKKVLLVSAFAAFMVVGCGDKEVAPAEKPSNNFDNTAVVVPEPSFDINAFLDNIKANVENVYFDFDKYDIRSDMTGVISNNANLLNELLKKDEVKKVANEITIVLEGNSDEWGSDEYNQALSLKRAKAVKDALDSQGLSGLNVKLVGYGETNPVCIDRTKECDAKNRRVEVKITK